MLQRLQYIRNMSAFDHAIHLSAATTTLVFLWFLWEILSRGSAALSWSFLTEGPTDFGRAGGIGPMIASTIWIVALTALIVVPLGLGTAIAITEFADMQCLRIRTIERCLGILAGTPSITFGLCGHAFFCQFLGLGVSLISGALTLACMVLPFFVRCAVEGLRSVSLEQRQLAAALSLSRWAALRHLVFPLASSALATALVISLGRALAETSALLFTTGYVTRWPTGPFDAGRSLTVHICDLAMNVPGGDQRAFGAAIVLIALTAVMNALGCFLMRKTIHH